MVACKRNTCDDSGKQRGNYFAEAGKDKPSPVILFKQRMDETEKEREENKNNRGGKIQRCYFFNKRRRKLGEVVLVKKEDEKNCARTDSAGKSAVGERQAVWLQDKSCFQLNNPY